MERRQSFSIGVKALLAATVLPSCNDCEVPCPPSKSIVVHCLETQTCTRNGQPFPSCSGCGWDLTPPVTLDVPLTADAKPFAVLPDLVVETTEPVTVRVSYDGQEQSCAQLERGQGSVLRCDSPVNAQALTIVVDPLVAGVSPRSWSARATDFDCYELYAPCPG